MWHQTQIMVLPPYSPPVQSPRDENRFVLMAHHWLDLHRESVSLSLSLFVGRTSCQKSCGFHCLLLDVLLPDNHFEIEPMGSQYAYIGPRLRSEQSRSHHSGPSLATVQCSLQLTSYLDVQNTEAGGKRKSLLGNDVNYYRQLYLDNSGKPGDLRLSEVTTGDKYAQGSMYVHQRL